MPALQAKPVEVPKPEKKFGPAAKEARRKEKEERERQRAQQAAQEEERRRAQAKAQQCAPHR
jgi:hypothetical protein